MFSYRKKSYRLFSFFLVILLCSGLFISIAQARASDYILSYTATVQAAGSGKVNVNFSIIGLSKMDQIGAMTIVLYENGTAVKTFQYTSTPSMMAYNTVQHNNSVTYNGVAGRSYYAIVTFWAGKQGGGDSRTKTTSTVIAT